jgi:hypothetical protein
MANTREFTDWSSSRSGEVRSMHDQGFTNVYDYKKYLINNTPLIAKKKSSSLKKNNTCANNGSNTFFVDSSSFGDFSKNVNPLTAADIVGVDIQATEDELPVTMRGSRMTLENLSKSHSRGKYATYH